MRAAAALVAAATVVAEIAAPAGSTPLAFLDATVGVTFAAGAAATAATSPRTAALALTVAAAWLVGTLAGIGGFPPEVASAATLSHRGPLALLVLAYPGSRLRGNAMRGLAVAALIAPFAPGGNGPAVTAAVAGLVAAATLASAARAPAALRAPRSAAATAALTIAIAAGLAATGAGSSTDLLVLYDVVLLASAAGLLASLAAGRWSAATATGLALELGDAPAGAPVTARLAEILRDPDLELRLRLRGGPWTDEAGRPVPRPAARNGGRALTRHVLDDGTEVILLHDPAAVPDPATAKAAVAVAAVTLDNARHDQEVRARIDQLRRLRRGLLDAADEERRQLEVELRSGPLRGVEQLDRLLRDLPGEQVEALRGELGRVRAELVGIAQGLYPAELLEHGLAGAVVASATRSPVPVTVDASLDQAALPLPVALTAYYVASEALANVAKHAHAKHARLELSASAHELLVRVVDDGAGGADPAGSGLSGVRERVRAVDGRFRVRSPAGAGTAIEARLPLSGD